LPAASHFLLLRQKKVTKEKATPLIPETPKIEPAGWAAKNSPRFCYFELVFCERDSTPLPLIHPSGSIFGGAERGESQNQDGGDGTFAITILASDSRFGSQLFRL